MSVVIIRGNVILQSGLWIRQRGRAREQQVTVVMQGSGSELVQQRTVRRVTGCSGTGLHRDLPSTVTLRPAGIDHGIVFRRSDGVGMAEEARLIPARWDHVGDTRLATTLANDAGLRVSTVEHLLAALAFCEIDNALIEIDGPEVPIMDGSAEPFVRMIDRVGTEMQDAARQVLRIRRAIHLCEGDRTIRADPADDFSVAFSIEFQSPAVAKLSLDTRDLPGPCKDSICRARTFGFLEDISALRSAGFALGGSLKNALVIDGARILNEGGLRFEDEPVRHKILDCIGDLYLAGGPILARITAHKTGHEFNNRLLRAVFADPDNWEWVRLPEERPADWTTTFAVAAG